MWSDLRFACRTLVRQPLFTGIVILTVALGIGGSTAVFSVVNAVLIRDLPYPNADRIYVMRAMGPDSVPGNVSRREFAPVYEHENHPVVEAAAIVWSQETQIVGSDGRPHPTVRYGVTDQFFEVFGTRMALGQGFERGDPPGRIVISHPIWRDVFASDPDIIGKPVAAEGMQLQVVGVTPAAFEFPQNPGFWYLMRIGQGYDNVRAYRGFMRLRPDRSDAQIRSELTRLADTLGPDPVTGTPPVLVVHPFLDYVVGNLKATVVILFGATGILLLIACINVTNLLLSRTTVRSREVALREAIGAGRWRVMRQLLTEAVLVVGAGGALGFALVAMSVGTLLAIAPEGLPRLDRLPIDRTVALFAVALTLATGVLVGLAPAWRLARNDLRSLINESGRGTPGGPARHQLFSTLVIAEIALAVVLVIGAGLLVRSYVNLTMTDPGFTPDRALTVTMNLTPRRQDGPVRMDAQGRPVFETSPYAPLGTFVQELEERVAGISGVESVGLTTTMPLVPNPFIATIVFTLPDQTGTDGDGAWTGPVRSVSPGYFDTMQMRLLNGRGLQRSDREGSPGVTVVNEAFARRYFPDRNPLGQRLRIRENRYVPFDTGGQFGHFMVDELEVVGVVSDVKYDSLAQPTPPAMYVSSGQFIDRRRAMVVRTSLERPEQLIPAIRRELDALDPQIGAQFAVYSGVVRSSLARERLAMTLLVIFGGVALLLAAIGVYGLMSYSVAQRTGEMALRSAMGASASQVMTLVMGRGMRLAVAGVGIGIVGAVALRQAVAGQLYGVSPLDLPVFLFVPAILFGVAAIACFLPARRATRVAPADLLRAE